MHAQFNNFDIQMTLAQAQACTHPGQCDNDVLALSQVPAIKRQMARILPEVLRAELAEYGAWDSTELADHGANIQRVLWIAAGNIADK